MYCFKCGFELADGSLFCSKCGTKLDSSTTYSTEKPLNLQGDDINRDVLISHIENMLYLECAKSNLAGKYNKLADVYQKLGIPKNFDEPVKPDLNLLDKVAENILLGTFMIPKIAFARKKELNKYQEDYAVYKKNLDNDAIRVNNENQRKKEIAKNMNDIKLEWTKVNDLCEKAYSINIIPMPFRSLASVNYLYSYLSSSNEPFSHALFHCDLDVIKKGIQCIAAQQQEILINQAYIISQNREIIHQNYEKIDYYAKIEENTARAAQYSKVAATNAETCAMYMALNYIR